MGAPRFRLALGGVLFAAALGGCAARGAGTPDGGAPTAAAPTPNGQSPSAGTWRPLFAGNTLAGWRGYRSAEAPAGWTVADGVLSKTAGVRDLVSEQEFGDFELEWEWRMGTGGNAGVFYRGTEAEDHIYWTGTEYQLLDDPNARDGQSRLTSAGAVYGLYPAPAGVVKPAGEWNASRIVARGAHVEHWLNGTKMGEYEAGSPDWEAKVRASKFAVWQRYGRARRGRLGIQGDHRGELAIRNMRVREL